MPNKTYYTKLSSSNSLLFNQWDLIILLILFSLLTVFVWGAQQMAVPYTLGKVIPISLSPHMLPKYAAQTVIRMGIALLLSLVFTFTIATLAAKNKRAERLILPLIDIMQSVPVLGFLSITVLGFIYLFPGSRLGPECAAIFAIFTSQVWNMALSFYQSLRTVPKELTEAANMFHLSHWQRFWRLEVPFATPSLIWNIMMSLSAGWFFVVACEAISVNQQNISLPGIGSYIAKATLESNYSAITYVILTMFIVIMLYDQILFRPLVAWSEKFKLEPDPNYKGEPWFLNLLHSAKLTQYFRIGLTRLRLLMTFPWMKRKKRIPIYTLSRATRRVISKTVALTWTIFLGIAGLVLGFFLLKFIYTEVTLSETFLVLQLGLITALKIMVLIIVCSLIWVPVGVWIGLNPQYSRIAQPIAQFLAAFPANLVYPVLFMFIVAYNLNVSIWSAPLMILGTQWYILFNVIAGASSLPQELHLVTKNYGVKKWLWWRKFILPAIFPYYITGAMTAAGGSWNASIVAEVVTWGGKTLHAKGLGAYITEQTTVGNFPRIALGIAVMSLYVIVINRLLWHKLYEFAEKRYQLG